MGQLCLGRLKRFRVPKGVQSTPPPANSLIDDEEAQLFSSGIMTQMPYEADEPLNRRVQGQKSADIRGQPALRQTRENRDRIARGSNANHPYESTQMRHPEERRAPPRVDSSKSRSSRSSRSAVAEDYAHMALKQELKAREASIRRELVEEARKELEADRAREYQRLRASLEAERRELRASMETEWQKQRAAMEAEWQKQRTALEAERQGVQSTLDTERQKLRMSRAAEQQELAEARNFLGPADSVSERDIVRGVRELNEEIFQATKRAADDCHIGVRGVGSVTMDEDVIGSGKLAQILESYPPREDDRTALEVALQAAITRVVTRIISSWDIHTVLDGEFGAIYTRMLQSESHFVAGRWRSLTRKYASSTAESTISKQQETEYVRDLLDRTSKVYAFSGAKAGSTEDLQESLVIIVRAALNVRNMIGEGIITSEYEAYVEQSGARFEPTTMEDEYPPTHPPADMADARIVVCPARLGLRRRERTSSGISEVVLVKPAVVLETIVEDLARDDQAAGYE
ncbi:hypothetical protein DAEQUDRAFT_430161 [Daedalea quercina L-15889]|uniref:Uncharacterized protein n=1 Tax=Daedalea quercina L-15889 TaxID=1314783 RepID=A0A165NFH2_9APHY|nr:hypothetical protein DAEQUDRAFT_430161 [Daedalea quercina L-15889]